MTIPQFVYPLMKNVPSKLLAIINKAALNIGVPTPFFLTHIFSSLELKYRDGIAGLYTICSIYEKLANCLFACSILHSYQLPKITIDGDCSHKIKRRLLLGRKVMTNLDSILKRRDITLQTKVRLVQAMVFPVVMYGCESWTVKNAECRRIDAFELWCWRRLLRVPWTSRRSNQSILKEISPGISLEGMMLKLKLQYFGHLMGRVGSLKKTLMLGGSGGRRRRGQQRIR